MTLESFECDTSGCIFICYQVSPGASGYFPLTPPLTPVFILAAIHLVLVFGFRQKSFY